MAVWAVEVRGDKGEVTRVIIPLAVDTTGKRLVIWERQPEKLYRAQLASGRGANADQEMVLLCEILEPMLQRELEHRGVVTTNRSFEAPLIGWVAAR